MEANLLLPQTHDTAVAPPLPPLPALAHTRDGQPFLPTDTVWSLRKRGDGGGTIRLNWSTVRLGPDSLHLSKLILAATAGTAAAMSTHNTFKSIALLAKWYAAERPGASPLEWTDVTPDMARAFLAFGMTTSEKGNHFSRVRTHYRYGVDSIRRPEFDEGVLLAMMSITAKGNIKGKSVLSDDPDTGHLTAPEVDAILAAIASGRGNPHDRVLVWLALEVGRRPLQYSLLRNADLLRVTTMQADGFPTRLYQIRFRRTKKRTVLDSTMTMPISKELGDELWHLRRGHDGERLLYWLNAGHPEVDLNTRMKRWAAATNLTTIRGSNSVEADDVATIGTIARDDTTEMPADGAPRRLHLYPYRFRYSIATNAHEEGASKERLAILLDQDDLQSLQMYTANSALSVLRIQDRVNAIYDPLVRRFKGMWTQSTAPMGLDGEPGRTIPGFAPQIQLDVGGIGHCGRNSVCGFSPVTACYSCDKFVAFTDGPHRDVVASLETAMERAEPRIALQLAPALAAAREVVAYLEENQIT